MQSWSDYKGEKQPGKGQQVKMTYVRFSTFKPQTEAKYNLNTIFVYTFYMLRISRLTNHYLNATLATTSYKSKANLNPRKVNNCHNFHVWEYGEYTQTDMTGMHGGCVP